MTESPASRVLPARPDLDQLKKQAKALRASGAHATLTASQLALARAYGFESWTRLKRAVEQITLRRLIEENDAAGVRALLADTPSLAKAPFADGSTPLHVAAGENRAAIVEVLVTAGAPLQSTYARSAHTALSWALTCWSYDAAAKLVELGHEPDLFCAAGLGDIARVEAFWRNGRLRRAPSRTGSSRYDAAGERLPSPPARDLDQVSDALYIACRCERVEVARWLLDHGADPNWRGYAGATCLAWAESSGNVELCALLRERGGSDDLRDQQYGATPKVFPIMVFAGWGFPGLLSRRLTADPSLVLLTSARGTPLHAAAAGGQVDTAKVLLSFGADTRATDPEGRTPADVAAAAGHTDLAALLRQ